MRPEFELNRARWDEATRFHVRDNVYGVEDFKAGRCRLHRVEVDELAGDIAGKRLLHLQCHFGLDTLSWARRGAIVTGVDFSPVAVEAARRLSEEAGIPAEFVCSDIYGLHEVLDREASYDVVYTSYGVLNWLPDLAGWGRQIARYLTPGGIFYIVEAHPTALMFPIPEDLERAGGFRPWISYFHDPAGMRWAPGPDYADPSAAHSLGCHEWHHSLGDIVNALIAAGLTIEWLHEFPFCAWEVMAGLEVVERFSSSHMYFGRPPGETPLPLLFSIRARRG
jgi:SAM-dependent methyltransferase